MIGVSSSGRSFKALGKYLVEGRNREAEGRVAWSSARNLPTDDPELAAKIMRATAAQNVRTSQPVYHLVLSFDPRDQVSREQMERIADRVLGELQLREHQVLIVAHADREHAHMHLLVNRVHPETGKMWDRWQDYPRIQSVLREEERALGLRAVETQVEQSEKARLEQRTEQLELVGTHERYNGNGRRRQHEREDFEAIRADFDAHDQVGELAQQRYSLEMDMAGLQANASRLETAFRRAERADDAFSRELAAVYRQPEMAKAAFFATVKDIGEPDARRQLREEPERFGELRTEERRTTFGRVQSTDAPARGAAVVAAAHAAELIEAQREIAALTQVMRPNSQDRSLVESQRVDSERAAISEQIHNALERLRGLREAERALPTREEVEYRLGQGLRRLSPPEFERLRLTLSAHRLTLAYNLRQMVRDAALGRDEEA
jgi:hypothetical protein